MTISTLELIRINLARRKAGLKVLTLADVLEALQNKSADNGAPDLDYLLDFDAQVQVTLTSENITSVNVADVPSPPYENDTITVIEGEEHDEG